MLKVGLVVALIFYDWKFVGVKLHTYQKVADQKDHHEQGDIRYIANCLHYHTKKLLKVFPEFSQLKNSY